MNTEQGLLAGYAKIDITPDYQIGLGGYSNAESRRNVMVEEPIYATCIALTDGDETILVYTIDNCACSQEMAVKFRTAAAEATGISDEKIFLSATHSHNCPSWNDYPEAEQYRQLVLDAIVEGAKKALEDRAPAQILAAKPEFPGMNFVRHYITENGTYAGSNFGTFKNNPAVGYVTEPDRQMVLVKFQREEPKKSILMVNWQGHPDCSTEIGFHRIAPSYIGPLRDALSAASGCLVAYYTGDDGNTNISSRVADDKHGLNWREYGVKMAQLAYSAMQDMQPVEGTGIKTARSVVEVDIDHSWDDKLEQANEVFDLWKSAGKAEGDALGAKYGFTSSYQARAIRSRYNMEKTTTLELNAFRVGGVGFTTGTYEMFSDAGIFVKKNSPYDFTVLLTGNHSYIPSDDAYNYRCYEADTGFFARGTAEKLANKYVEMLAQIQ